MLSYVLLLEPGLSTRALKQVEMSHLEALMSLMKINDETGWS